MLATCPLDKLILEELEEDCVTETVLFCAVLLCASLRCFVMGCFCAVLSGSVLWWCMGERGEAEGGRRWQMGRGGGTSML